MSISPKQLKMARAALGWTIKDLAKRAAISAETVAKAEQADVGTKSLAALQKALEEAGIEFLPEFDAVAHHDNMDGVAILADPSMPLGIRRSYGTR